MLQKKQLHNINQNPNFIGSWILESALCEELIVYFEKHQDKQTIGSTSTGLDLERKDRQDLSIVPNEINLPGNEIFQSYFEQLFKCYKDYNNQWPFLRTIVTRLDIGRFNIGRYEPGQHFKAIHCERSSLGTLHRLFAFMTYLNDVQEGGSTYFSHYNLDIKPEKGLTLIWPAEWTHAHNGNIVKTGKKYIVTGWLSFPGESN